LGNFVFLTELSSVALLITESVFFFHLCLSQTWPNLPGVKAEFSTEVHHSPQASQARKMLREVTSPLSELSVMILEW
jgi:hypothetical protein